MHHHLEIIMPPTSDVKSAINQIMIICHTNGRAICRMPGIRGPMYFVEGDYFPHMRLADAWRYAQSLGDRNDQTR